MAEALSEQELAAIKARCERMTAVNARLRSVAAPGQPHVTLGALSLWLDELCSEDIPRLLAEVQRLRTEVAYLRQLRERAGENETEFLRAALQRIANATWEVWRADRAARDLVQEARWALGDGE